MTSVKIMKTSEFSGEVGSLMFPSDYWDATFHCDTKKIHKEFPELKEIRIKKVMIMTNNHPDFKNIKNEKIAFKGSLCCSAEADGAVRGSYCFEYYNPVGDVIILI